MATLTRLLAFYETLGYEHWGEYDYEAPSVDEDLDNMPAPRNLGEAVQRYRTMAMRTLAMHLNLNYDEIIRLRRARMVRQSARKQRKASKRQHAQLSSADRQPPKSTKAPRRTEVADSERQTDTTSSGALPIAGAGGFEGLDDEDEGVWVIDGVTSD